jgi:3-dehydroquinate synthase
MRTIKSRSGDYTVQSFPTLGEAIGALGDLDTARFLVDRRVYGLLVPGDRERFSEARTVLLDATEQTKSYGALERVFLELLDRGLRRDGRLVVIGGGILQDAGCFIASVLSRGIAWDLVPTTLLAQADSCIGSKSSVNIGPYKNQIGTFHPPGRVLIVPALLRTLPPDDIRSGIGEIIKLQALSGGAGFAELMDDLSRCHGATAAAREEILSRWVERSMDVKQPLIEADEFDRGPRLLLNYGHTFGHAFEAVTGFAIPHGIAVTLGMVAATDISARLGMTTAGHAAEVARMLHPWHTPHAGALEGVSADALHRALARDKKNVGRGLTCILTRGFGRMERVTIGPDETRELVLPRLGELIASGFLP